MPYLRSAVESVLSQDQVELSYVIQDAGSTDGGVEFLNSIDDSRVLVVVEEDGGPSDALNRGFSKLSVDIFGFLNSDDLLHPGALKYVSDVFERDPSVCILQGSGFIVDERIDSVKTFIPSRTSARLMKWDVSNILQPSLFFRADCLPRFPFNGTNRTSWDGELLMNLLEGGHSWRRSCQPLSTFRLHESSISGSGRLESQYLMDKTAYLYPGAARPPRKTLFQPLLRLANKSEALVWSKACVFRARMISPT